MCPCSGPRLGLVFGSAHHPGHERWLGHSRQPLWRPQRRRMGLQIKWMREHGPCSTGQASEEEALRWLQERECSFLETLKTASHGAAIASPSCIALLSNSIWWDQHSAVGLARIRKALLQTCIRVLTTQRGLVANTVAAPAPDAAMTLLSKEEKAAPATVTETPTEKKTSGWIQENHRIPRKEVITLTLMLCCSTFWRLTKAVPKELRVGGLRGHENGAVR